MEEFDDLVFIVEPFVQAEGVEGDAGALKDERFREGDGLAFVAGSADEIDRNDLTLSLDQEIDGDAGDGVPREGLPADGAEGGGEVGEGGLDTTSQGQAERDLFEVAAEE